MPEYCNTFAQPVVAFSVWSVVLLHKRSFAQWPFVSLSEDVFDEDTITDCYLTDTETITAAIRAHETSRHLRYLDEVVTQTIFSADRNHLFPF